MRTYHTALCAVTTLFLVLWLGSCKKENSQPQQYPIPANLQMISSGYAVGAAIRVEVYASANLFVGYNKLYLALYDSASNKRITQAQISLTGTIKLATTGLSQSCPVENPVSTNADNGLFNAAAVFVAPSAGSNGCTLTAHVQNTSAGAAGDFVSSVSVVQTSPAKAYSVITLDDSTNLFISLVQPVSPQVGNNNFEITVHRLTSAMNFVPDSSYSVVITPVMPAMSDMTSPNNVNPVYTANGHYLGQVVFVMSGAWQVNLKLMHNGAIADTMHYFDINL